MLGSFRKGRANVLIWALMAALIVGLAGFGIGVGGGVTTGNVAEVGDAPVTSDDYVRALQQELTAMRQQLGRDLPMAEARQYGLDRIVLARLINDAALDGEATRLGLSVGADAVRAQVTATPAFQGADGSFSMDAYVFALERIGLRPAEFETLLRRETARAMIAGAVQAPAGLPPSAADTVLDFLGEKRGFAYVVLDPALLPSAVPAPTDADLAAWHAANAARYTRPETRVITTAAVAPDALAATIEIPEDELRAAYDAAAATYAIPERRALERIGFGSDAEAAAARARLDSGAVSFDALAAERGLGPDDTDQGTVTAATLDPAVRDAVFAAAGPGLVGPVPTPLGPSIFRVNAVLAATTTSFEDARPELLRQRQRAAAEARMNEDMLVVEDLVAGGATLEEIAGETDLELGTLELSTETTGGLADDPAFRAAAAEADTGIETDLVRLADGGLASLRVERVEPARVLPLAEIRDRVAADWTADATSGALEALASGYASELAGEAALPALAERIGRSVLTAAPITRGEIAPGVPPELVAEIFAAAPGEAVTLRDGANVILAEVGEVQPFDPSAPETAGVAERLQQQFRAAAADDVLTLFSAALRDGAGVSLDSARVESTLARFP